MKGIILAGGTGSRLYPITKSVSKQLLCIYDKPMVFYPLTILLRMGITDVLLISSKNHLTSYKNLLGDGSNLGFRISYEIQKKPEGIAQAFIVAEQFIGKENVCLILGDNIFYGNGLINILSISAEEVKKNNNAVLFGYYVNKPSRYGVIEFDENNYPIHIDEKPVEPKSNYAVVGISLYPNSVVKMAKEIQPSPRGELEITNLNNDYINEKKCNIKILDSGITWLDTGTPDSLLEASNFVRAVEKRQGLKVACIEQVAYEKGYISYKRLRNIAKNYPNSEYGKYLLSIEKK